MVNVGDHYRSTVTNKEYIVKKVIRDMVVLETPDGDGQVLTDSSSLRILYRKVGEDPESSSGPPHESVHP